MLIDVRFIETRDTAGPSLLLLCCLATVPGCKDSGSPVPSESGTDTDGGMDTQPPDGEATGSTGVDTGPGERSQTEQLSPTDHLIRASMALRGTRPSDDELLAVHDDPDALEGIVDTYLTSDDFGATIRDMHEEVLLVRASARPDLFYFPILPGLDLPSGMTDGDVSRRVWEAPLRLIEYVVMNDRPYTEIVTADYFLADPVVAQVWGVDYTGVGENWAVTEWADDRPAAGILSDSVLFYRYKSMPSNANRGRANALSRALLCYDFLAADIPIDGSIDLSDPDAVADAVVNDPNCSACHSKLDPLASFLFGHNLFQLAVGIDGYPMREYISAQEPAWQSFTGQPPAVFGEPGDDLADMGREIAEHAWFSRCAVEHFYGYLTQIDPDDAPSDALADYDDMFVASGYDARALARAIVLSDEFATSHAEDATIAESVVGYQKARPRQLDRMVEDLTGFAWTWDGAPNVLSGDPPPTGSELRLLGDGFFGFESLAGGTDGYYVTRPVFTVNPTTSLVLRKLAELAAGYVVDHDLSAPVADRYLLTATTPANRDEVVIRDQLVVLHRRLLGEFAEPGDPEIDESYDLFTGVLDRSDEVEHAWQVTLTAMLQDYRIIHY